MKAKQHLRVSVPEPRAVQIMRLELIEALEPVRRTRFDLMDIEALGESIRENGATLSYRGCAGSC
jgi:hypothetical protein